MTDIHLEVEGVIELRRQLDNLTKLEERGAIRRALRVGANLIREEARRRVPVQTGLLRKNIITVITVTARKTIAQVKVRKAAFYGVFVELGSSHQPARAFLRPAADARAGDVSDAVGKVLGEEIDKIVSGF